MKRFTKENYKDLTIAEFEQYRKDPRIIVYAAQIPEVFEVETLEGLVCGKMNDYLMMGIDGELYPCDQYIFHSTYIDADSSLISGLMEVNEELLNRQIDLLEIIKDLEQRYDHAKNQLFEVIDDELWEEVFGEE